MHAARRSAAGGAAHASGASEPELEDAAEDSGPCSEMVLRCAQVLSFENLNTREVVCEIVEGDITQLAIQFHDKLGNVCEGNTKLAVICRELPKQVDFLLG